MTERRSHSVQQDANYMRLALGLARRAAGDTSPNPMVGALLVRNGRIIGRGWHQRAGGPHAEVAALRDAIRRGRSSRGATLYVTLEPCSTHGRTPPCTAEIISAGIRRVVVGATDCNPRHSGRAFRMLRRAGIVVAHGVLAQECERLNEAFNHWIIHHTPLVTVKAAMTLDGRIATASGESKWITGEKARAWSMNLRRNSDAILVGVNTILEDDPSLTYRPTTTAGPGTQAAKRLRRIVLDSFARTPITAKVVSDEFTELTMIVVGRRAPARRVAALAERVRVLVAPALEPSTLASRPSTQINLRWLLRKLGSEEVTSLLVEGGGEVNGSFLLGRLAQRVAFFYAPKILGGRDSRRGVAGTGALRFREILLRFSRSC